MKAVSDYPDVQVDRLQRLKEELVHMDSSLTQIGSVRTTVDEEYDIPVLRVRINDNYPPVCVREMIKDHQFAIATAFITDEGNLVILVGDV